MQHQRLPVEVLRAIFRQMVSPYPHENETAVKTLCECQLVCREWRWPAQQTLYMNVRLGKNASKFTSVIKHTTKLGEAVGMVFFSSEFSSCEDTTQILETIDRCCPNILHLYCHSSRDQALVWSHFTSNKVKFKNLKTLEGDSMFHCDDKELLGMYTSIALEHMTTLTSLSVSSKDPEYQTLLQHLEKFSALTSLHLINVPFNSLVEFNKMIDNIPSVHYLNFYSLDLSNCTEMIYDISPNTALRKIRVDQDVRFCTQALRYIGLKFQGLNKINTNQIIGPRGSEAEENAWWDEFNTMICKFGDRLSMVLSNFTRMNQVQKCMELVGATLGNIGKREFTLTMNPGLYEDYKINTILSRKTDAYSITFDTFLFADVNVEGILDCMHEYLPNNIGIKDVEHISALYEVFIFKKPALGLSSTDAIMDHIQDFCTRDSWAILNKAITTFGQLEESKMCLGKMVLCNKAPNSQATYPDLKISELLIKDSIFHEDTLPQLSLRLPKLNKLILDTCCFLKVNQYSLKIFLPATQMHSFGLKIIPFIHATFWDEYDLYDSKDCCLEDPVLLQAVSPNGKYTLKIETDAKSQVSLRQGSKIIQQDCDDIGEGTKDNFLIWIKCKDMKEFAVTGDKNSSYSWNPTFEPLL